MGNKSLEELIAEYFDIGTNECMAYMCTRDKSAFSIGTMSLDDFEEFDDDNCSDIADYLSKNNVVIQKHGYWIPTIRCGMACIRCSVCGMETASVKKYCHDCGAKMDKEVQKL